jgi:Gpi18-like mannosyltransferase
MTDVAAQAPRLEGGGSVLNFSLRIPAILPLLLAGLVVRLAIAPLDGFGVDMGTFQAWAQRLAAEGPWNFYSEEFFTDYAPGYMYVLWIIGELDQIIGFTPEQFQYALKLPSIAADLASAYLIYVMLKDKPTGMRLGATAIYLFLPITLFIGAFWGQVDSILAFFLLLSVHYIGQNRPVAGAVAFTVGFLVKPQAVAALPFLAFWIIRDNWPHYEQTESGQRVLQVPWTLIYCTLVPLGVLVLLITPFFSYEPWRLVSELYDATNVANYRVNSFWAYNFWNMGGLFEWGFRCDLASACEGDGAANATEFLGIATRYWSLALFAGSIGMVIFSMRKARGTGFLALGVALSMFAFYLFLTRMHERYVFAAFLPFLVACALLNSRVLWGVFVATVTVHFLNMYHVFSYYYLFNPETEGNYPSIIRLDFLNEWLQKNDAIGFPLPLLGTLSPVQILSMIFVLSFVVLVAAAYSMSERETPPPQQAAPQ